MKKIIGVLGIYTALIFAACVGVSFFYGNLPELLPQSVRGYTFFRALEWFLRILPAVALTGFIAGCTVEWRRGTRNSTERFSPAMFARFRWVLVVGIIIAAALTLSAELFLPAVKKHQSGAEQAPEELSRSLFLARRFQIEGNSVLAWQYASHALAVSPDSEQAAVLLKEAQDAIDRSRAAALSSGGHATGDRVVMPIKETDEGYTVKELLEKSDEAALAQDWFDAHYWASLAAKACSGTDTNLARATDMVNYAWNKLGQPSGFGNEEEAQYFAKKKEGYVALANGDDLKAYYIFNTLSLTTEGASDDPDVVRYLAIAKERIENDYFFMDETDGLRKMETTHNVYFAVTQGNGSRWVFYIRGTVQLPQTGGYVRYLDGVYAAQYTSTGRFIKSFEVPFAKAVAMPVSAFDDSARSAMGIQKGWKSVPYLLLQAVDRETEGIISRPTYSYSESGLPEDIASRTGMVRGTGFAPAEPNEVELNGAGAEPTYMILAMDYADFDLLNGDISGSDAMPLVSLASFAAKASRYGFAQEVYRQALVGRVTYPLYILIIVVLAAVFAWNYRIGDENSVFRFWWILIFPLITIILFIGMGVVRYLFTINNYLIVGVFGQGALVAAIVAYALVLVAVSVLFLARHSR